MNETNVDLSALPEGWVWATVEDVSKLNPRIDKHSIDDDLEVTFLPMKCVEELSGKIDLSETKYFSEVKRKSYTPFQDGDILFAKVTPCMENGKIAIAHDLKNGIGFGSTEFHVIRLWEEQSRQFSFFYFLQQKFRQEAKRAMTGAVGLLRVPTHYMRKVPIPLPPLPEQNRIVAKIEELFTKLDAGKEELLQAKARLKRYRQSVLKAAMEGKLTEDWRKKHGNEIEPASVLLDRILKERREKWEAEQLEQMSAKGKIPKDDKWKNKYKEPLGPDISKLPNLPDGWVWVTIKQLSYKVQYGSSSKCTADENGIPVFRMGNILDGKLIINDLKYLPQDHNEFPNLLLETGDILFNRTNSAELVGKTAVYKGLPTPCSFASYLIRVKVTSGIFPDIISYYINSTYGRQWIASVVSQQVGQANVNGTKLQALAVPLPPYLEQEQFISEVEHRLSVADAVEATVDAELKRSDALRQSILKQAFSGKLVPQDPNDEPAEKLLECIKKEKAKREAEQKAERKTKKQLALFEH